MAWKVVAASATGRSHLDAGTGCQDAFAFLQEGRVLVAAVCDGAGSAPYSDVGARTVAQGVVDALAARLQCGQLLESVVDHDADQAVEHAVRAAVAAARASLEQIVADARGHMRDYACTLVGVLATPDGGSFFHIGDGVAVCDYGDARSPVVSSPENGEYANETWFVTGQDWDERLRLTRFAGGMASIALMSDGAEAFAMEKGGGGLFRPFFDPVRRHLQRVDAVAGSRALHGTLSDPRTDAITGDDKTLLVALAD